MSSVLLDKIQPKFRHLVDLLFFSDRTDIDLSEFYNLLQDNRKDHLDYLIDTFHKSCSIFWEDGHNLWNNRLSFLFSLEDKHISKYISSYLEQSMYNLMMAKKNISPVHDLPYLQFLEYCKVKTERKESLQLIKNYLTESSTFIKNKKLIDVANSLIPIVFKDINEYAEIISKKIIPFPRSFGVLQELERQGYNFNRQPVVQLVKDIIIERARSYRNISVFFEIINDKEILKEARAQYKIDYRKQLLDLLSNCDYRELEERHLKNIENVIF